MDNATERALETLRRLDEEEACQRALAPEIERPEPVMPETWDATNPKNYTSVIQLSTAEYGAWLDAGKPPLQRAAKVAPAPEKRTSQAASGVSRRELEAIIEMVAEESGNLVGELRKELAWLKADTEQAHLEYKTIGKLVDQHAREIAELKREAALEKRLEDQRVRRRIDQLEGENNILRAIRGGDEGEDELPAFLEWRNAQ